MYTVFSIYYKNGEFSTDILKDNGVLREFCMSELERYDYYYDNVDYDGIEDIETLIYKTIEYGTEFIKKQRGLGVVSIIKGDNTI